MARGCVPNSCTLKGLWRGGLFFCLRTPGIIEHSGSLILQSETGASRCLAVYRHYIKLPSLRHPERKLFIIRSIGLFAVFDACRVRDIVRLG